MGALERSEEAGTEFVDAQCARSDCPLDLIVAARASKLRLLSQFGAYNHYCAVTKYATLTVAAPYSPFVVVVDVVFVGAATLLFDAVGKCLGLKL